MYGDGSHITIIPQYQVISGHDAGVLLLVLAVGAVAFVALVCWLERE